MQVFYNIDDVFIEAQNGSIAVIGNFDGVHIAHKKLIEDCVLRAKNAKLPAVLITFDPHPSTLFSKTPILPLFTLEERLRSIAELGIDCTYVLSFTKEFAMQSAAQFSKEFLRDSLHCNELVVGHNFLMGSDRNGGERLANLLEKLSCNLIEHEEVFLEYDNTNITVSSSAIREALKNGDIELVNAMLGRAHAIHGIIEHGAKRGSALLGFPTANMDTGNLLLPKKGVYATSARLVSDSSKTIYKAITNIGYNPTFAGEKLLMETCILDFNEDIYGEELKVYFHERIRDEKKFDSIDMLIEQLNQDKRFRLNLGV